MQMESTPSKLGDGLFALKKALRLPEDLRNELKQPLGEVVNEARLKRILEDVSTIVSIGDMCSLSIFKMGFVPDIAVVDFMIERTDVQEERAEIQEIGQIVINVENPPGTITEQLWQAVEKAYQSEKKVRIEVDGEEDLATLPCVWLAPKNTAVVYGLPKIGLVVVLDEHEAKIKVKNVLAKMN